MINNEQELSDFVSESEINNLRLELAVNPDLSSEELALRKLREAAPIAALQLVHLAAHAHDVSIRLKASTYVLDHTLGKPGMVGSGISARQKAGTPMDDLTKMLLNEAEAIAAGADKPW